MLFSSDFLYGVFPDATKQQEFTIAEVNTDSRKEAPDSLFVPIRGNISMHMVLLNRQYHRGQLHPYGTDHYRFRKLLLVSCCSWLMIRLKHYKN